MTNWKTFYEELPGDNCKIVAMFDDGSGLDAFRIKDGLVFYAHDTTYAANLGDERCFEECGYLYWCDLPKNFKLWGRE